MTTEQKIWDYMKSKGLNDYGAAGLMGNLYAESGLSSINLQNTYNTKLGLSDADYTAQVDNGIYQNFVKDSAGYGLAQWTFWSRKQNLYAFAKSRGVSIGDMDMQLEFLFKELGGYPGLLVTLQTASSVRDASDAVLLNFERPASVGPNATPQQKEDTCVKRANYGKQYYDKFAAAGVQKGECSMKYSETNKPLVCMQTQSTCYKGTRTMNVVGVLWHSTGANNPNLKRYVQPSDNDPNRTAMLNLLGKNTNGNDWNHVSTQAGLNCWIGKLADGNVTTIQTMPWNYRPWGCGSGKKGSCNTGWIQFEICEDSLTNAEYFNKIYKEACEITAYLCKLYNIDPHGTVRVNGVDIPTILCHQDSYRLGFGSNHGDVLHWFPKFGKSMETARNDVAALMGNSASPNETPVNYQVRVTADDGLNCRSTHSTSGSIVTTYAKGTVLTVLKECNGWGFVGAGWVSLTYTEKIGTTAEMEDDEDMTLDKFKELMGQYRAELQDNDCGSWSQAARDWATSIGLIAGAGNGPDGKPNYMWADTLTREQAAQLFYRFAQLMGKV